MFVAKSSMETAFSKLSSFGAATVVVLSLLSSSCSGDGQNSNGINTGGTGSTSTSSTGTADTQTGNTGQPTVVADTPREYIWRNGVYLNSESLKACAFPEHSTSSVKYKGSVLEELLHLRSAVKERFYWSDELTDIDPNSFLYEPIAFVEHLNNMTKENGYYSKLLQTSSSFNKDNVRQKYLIAGSDRQWNQRLRVSQNASYGINWLVTDNNEEKSLHVRYTEGKEHLYRAMKDIYRGDQLISVDGQLVETLIDSSDSYDLYEALYTERVGVTKKFVFRDNYNDNLKEIFLTSSNVPHHLIHRHTFFSSKDETVGYINFSHLTWNPVFRGFIAEDLLNVVFNRFKNRFKVDDMIVDFRYTSRGSLRLASQVAFLIAGSKTKGKLFARIDTPQKLSRDNTDEYAESMPFIYHCLRFLQPSCGAVDYERINIPAPVKSGFRHYLNLNRVFVIVSKETCGAAEAFINGLLGIDFEVILIGGNTCGAPYLGSQVGTCGIKYFVPESKVSNDKNFGSYENGFRPSNASHLPGIPVKGCFAEETKIEHAIDSRKDPFVKAALQYHEFGTCPPVPSNLKRSDD